MSRLLILGGSDVGISAALCARELDATWQVTVVVEDTFPNYSICGLPFFLSGEVQDYQQLAYRTHSELSGAEISLLFNHQERTIEPGAQEWSRAAHAI